MAVFIEEGTSIGRGGEIVRLSSPSMSSIPPVGERPGGNRSRDWCRGRLATGRVRRSHSGSPPRPPVRSGQARRPCGILLGQDINGDLRPVFRRQEILHLKDDRAVWIHNARCPADKGKRRRDLDLRRYSGVEFA